jgi:hypothetical protein
MSKTFSMTNHAGGLFLASAKPGEVRHMSQDQAKKKSPALRHHGRAFEWNPLAITRSGLRAAFGFGQYRSVQDTCCIMSDFLKFS